MTPFQRYGRMSEADLALQDPALVNLACGAFLPGVPEDASPSCQLLDAMARATERELSLTGYLFERNPDRFRGSQAYFGASVLTTVLQRDFGIVYATDTLALSDDEFFRNPENLFIHGALKKRGTCASLPVVYLAVAWRLRWPLRLVTCRQHSFVRWEGAERFNIECSAEGFVFHPDDHYRTWPKPLTDKQVVAYQALVSLTGHQAMAVYVAYRGACLRANRVYQHAVAAFANACELNADCWSNSDGLAGTMDDWKRFLRSLTPPRFPCLSLQFPQRWYPSIPRDLEVEIVHLLAWENLLKNPEYNARWWQPLRDNPDCRPGGLPAHVNIEYPKATAAAQKPVITLSDTLPAGFAKQKAS